MFKRVDKANGYEIHMFSEEESKSYLKKKYGDEGVRIIDEFLNSERGGYHTYLDFVVISCNIKHSFYTCELGRIIYRLDELRKEL